MDPPTRPLNINSAKPTTPHLASAGADFRRSLSSLSAPYQAGAHWFREHGVSLPRARRGKGARGPRGLAATCLRVLADNIGAATRAAVDGLPERLRWALWRELLPRTMSLHAWDVVGGSLLEESVPRAADSRPDEEKLQDDARPPTMAMHRYCATIYDPACDLCVYVDPLKRLEACLVYLRLDGVPFARRELFSLADLPQLAVLELGSCGPGDDQVDDVLIRAWSRAEGLASLRVLRVTSDRHEVSTRSLAYLRSFPALEIVDITGPVLGGRPWRETAPGWAVAEQRESLFATYAAAYLDRPVNVGAADIEGMTRVFENDRQPLAPVRDPRMLMPRALYPDGSDHPGLDLNANTGRESIPRDNANSGPARTDAEIFFFLGLLDQENHVAEGSRRPQMHAAGVALPRDRFVHLRLHNGDGPPRRASPQRTIFSRRREHQNTTSRGPEPETQPHGEPPPSWAPRADDRRQTNLKPRKRQKTAADLLSSLGVP